MARDGEHKECPIIPNNVIRLTYGEGPDDVLHVAPTHDTVQMFPEPKYNYLRYYDVDTTNIIAVFLGQNVLAELVEGGIPLCIRDSITEGEVEVYEHHVGKIAAAGMAMIEPVEEPQLTQAEIDWFWKEVE